MRAGDEAHRREDPLWLWNPGQKLPKVQNSGISDPTKSTDVLQKIPKKTKYEHFHEEGDKL